MSKDALKTLLECRAKGGRLSLWKVRARVRVEQQKIDAY